jgi:predicted  nucleic acid-binding Zn-ribbon protein
MIMYDWECEHCGLAFERAEDPKVSIVTCSKCGGDSFKVFPTKAPSVELKYNPKTDIVDWDGNKTQYYRKYEEAKSRGENVRLPEEGE